MSTGAIIAIMGGVAIFGLIAYAIVKSVDNTNAFGDVTGLVGGLLGG